MNLHARGPWRDHIQRQKGDWRLPGAGGRDSVSLGLTRKFWPHNVNVLSAMNGTLKHG